MGPVRPEKGGGQEGQTFSADALLVIATHGQDKTRLTIYTLVHTGWVSAGLGSKEGQVGSGQGHLVLLLLLLL